MDPIFRWQVHRQLPIQEDYRAPLHYSRGTDKWSTFVPRKVNIFIWRASRNLILVRTQLAAQGLLLDSTTCPICTTDFETANHAINHCSVSRQVWSAIATLCDIDVQVFLQESNLLAVDSFAPPNAKLGWQGIIYITAWCIWKARNGMVMQIKQWRATQILADRQVLSNLWITNRCRKLNLSWTDWLLAPIHQSAERLR